ncbi:Rrf2 family transcriptional regulator [Lactobacillus intestinalis]|uniref:Transcriptional regulator n=1 Tax=Lactobacillus intestinalis DSM 6629 TaxID=1423761 RepID=A0ABR5PQD9_9LACO|nr:Rrf2 family transcriptional regulator [Lactobacillus intestinalis]KRM31770.1 transcriptional regulator [Lactobacillus intestinalis DSM 6629]
MKQVLRHHLQQHKFFAIKTTHGTPDPKLAKATDQISLLDVYLVVEKNKPLFQIDYKTNPDCIVGGNIQETLKEYYNQAEVAAKAKLNSIKLSDVIDTILVKQKEKEAFKRQTEQ